MNEETKQKAYIDMCEFKRKNCKKSFKKFVLLPLSTPNRILYQIMPNVEILSISLWEELQLKESLRKI